MVMNSTQQSMRMSRASLVMVSPGGRISEAILLTVALSSVSFLFSMLYAPYMFGFNQSGMNAVLIG